MPNPPTSTGLLVSLKNNQSDLPNAMRQIENFANANEWHLFQSAQLSGGWSVVNMASWMVDPDGARVYLAGSLHYNATLTQNTNNTAVTLPNTLSPNVSCSFPVVDTAVGTVGNLLITAYNTSGSSLLQFNPRLSNVTNPTYPIDGISYPLRRTAYH